MAVARGGKQDLLNSGVAGALAGSIGSLRTRNPAMIGGSAALSGCLMMVIDGLQGGASQVHAHYLFNLVLFYARHAEFDMCFSHLFCRSFWRALSFCYEKRQR